MAQSNLTPRQQKWFASIRDGLQRETGRSLVEWVSIARACPETTRRAQLAWLKAEHGLLQNRAMLVLGEMSGTGGGWDDPGSLTDALWRDAASRAIMEAVDTAASAHADTIRTARKGFTAWSRRVQFAAARPLQGGGAMLGLALVPASSALLSESRNEAWSERLRSRLRLTKPADVDPGVIELVAAAWRAS